MLELVYGPHAVVHLKAPVVLVVWSRAPRHIRDEEPLGDWVRLLRVEDLPVRGKLQAADAEFSVGMVSLP